MMEFAFAAPTTPSVPIAGTTRRFPVHRIYCVGRNYADHAKEMGAEPPGAPIFFGKPPDALVENGATIPYPGETQDFQHEIELVVAIGASGRGIDVEQGLAHVFGYAAGNDLTRRDLQGLSKKKGLPWETGKGFDRSAPIAAIRPVSEGHIDRGRIWLSVNGTVRQESDVRLMIWSVASLIAELSKFFELRAGDLIFTGTPAGVGALRPGDRLEGGIEGLEVLRNTIGDA